MKLDESEFSRHQIPKVLFDVLDDFDEALQLSLQKPISRDWVGRSSVLARFATWANKQICALTPILRERALTECYLDGDRVLIKEAPTCCWTF